MKTKNFTSETLNRVETAIANDIYKELCNCIAEDSMTDDPMDSSVKIADNVHPDLFKTLQDLHIECVNHHNAHVTENLNDTDYEEWLEDIYGRCEMADVDLEESKALIEELGIDW